MGMFKDAVREQNKLRLAIEGPSGSGKTLLSLMTALRITSPSKVFVIDTERNTATKYVNECWNGITMHFMHANLPNSDPDTYVKAIDEAIAAGAEVIIIDSYSHAWAGTEGILAEVDKLQIATRGNKLMAWAKASPKHARLLDKIATAPCHMIATLRVKTEWSVSKNEQGKTVVEKLGLKPIQREDIEYEYDVVVDLDLQHNLTVSKTRCPAVDGLLIRKPGGDWIDPVVRWLLEGKEQVAPLPVALALADAIQPPPPQEGFVPAVQTPPAVEGYIETLVDDIKTLAQGLAWTPEKLAKVCERAGVKRLAEIPLKDLEAFKEFLLVQFTKADAAKRF